VRPDTFCNIAAHIDCYADVMSTIILTSYHIAWAVSQIGKVPSAWPLQTSPLAVFIVSFSSSSLSLESSSDSCQYDSFIYLIRDINVAA